MSNVNAPVVFDIKYHFVWHTKFRTPILQGDLRKRARELLRQDCEAKGMNIIEGKLGKNYIYMMVSCPAHRSPSEIMRLLKGRSSKLLQEEFPYIKEKNLHGSLWDSGYFCATIGDTPIEVIRNYIDGLPGPGFQP